MYRKREQRALLGTSEKLKRGVRERGRARRKWRLEGGPPVDAIARGHLTQHVVPGKTQEQVTCHPGVGRDVGRLRCIAVHFVFRRVEWIENADHRLVQPHRGTRDSGVGRHDDIKVAKGDSECPGNDGCWSHTRRVDALTRQRRAGHFDRHRIIAADRARGWRRRGGPGRGRDKIPSSGTDCRGRSGQADVADVDPRDIREPGIVPPAVDLLRAAAPS